MLSLREVADRLGVSEMTVRRLVKRGELVAVRVGGQYRISEENLQRYISERQTGKVEALGFVT